MTAAAALDSLYDARWLWELLEVYVLAAPRLAYILALPRLAERPDIRGSASGEVVRQRHPVTTDCGAGRRAEVGIGLDFGKLRALDQAVE